ncbi:histidine kinase N-terminal 7TM domain-containing protein [Candidatus Leptofilum sp.]|uniref:histidine kinase N-terminal 7TM domain-containing protein n=1 Tax=Candidatus Leptofilum sp. TaxID=3241576 RepID=UPI003B5A728A
MIVELSPYTIPLAITAVIALASMAYTYRQPNAAGSRDLLSLLLAITIWVIGYIFELNGSSLASKLFWAKAEYFGIVFIPVSYLLFVLKYIGAFDKIEKPRRFTAVLLILPLITLLLVWTNEQHGLIWPSITLEHVNNLTYLVFEHGLWFWTYIGYVYLLLAVSSVFLLRKMVTTPQQFQGQIILVVMGSLCPWLSNIVYLTDSNPVPYLDLTPFAFAITAFCFTIAWFRFSFLDVVPIARERVVEQLKSGVIVLDHRNRVLDVNETAVTLLQQEEKALLGKPFVVNCPSWAPLEAALAKNQNTKLELSIAETFYEVSVTPLENLNKRANGRLITFHNITQRKETELLLQQAKETAEAANQAKNHFLTNMSHEIRTPLNAVVGMAEMLRQTNMNANQNEMVDVIAQSSNTLVELINNILDFSRLEAGNLSLNNQVFDLIDCIEASLEAVQQAAGKKMIKLTYRIVEQTPTLLTGDPVRLRQILVNLLENGVKFSEEGYVHIEVSHIQNKPNISLEFEVCDTGIGIAAEQISQLFSPFQQVDGSLTRTHGGNGLGLVICKRLIERMGGEIYLLSEIGKGTTVHFSVQMGIATTQVHPVITLRKNDASLAGKRLLVIAKNAAQRRQISKEARVAGLEVYVAGSSKEAAYWIDHSLPFHMVLLDTAVWQAEPDILSQLTNKESSTPLPTILMGQQEDVLRQTMLRQPGLFAGTLTLPIKGPQLYDLLMAVLSVGSRAETKREPGESMAERFPLRILLVEDNQLNRRVIQNILGKLGYEADTAVNGRIAVELASQHAYDVILMDVQMPEMDGVTATKQILAECAQGKRPYIVAVTAHALPGDRENYLAAGMNQYLSKPVTIKQLVELLYQGIEFQNQPSNNLASTPIEAPASVPSAQPIDMEALAQLVGKDTHEFLERMTPIFLEDTALLMQSLETAVQTHDSLAIRHAAHTLKGSSASMGMTSLAAFSHQLEQIAKADQLQDAHHLFDQVKAEYDRVQTTLATLSKAGV